MLFVPRQVALAASSHPHAAAASAMAKEEPKKEKKSKRKAAAAANGAAAAAPAPGARAAVVASVAAFLESAGLPQTLAALQSEAGLEAGAWGSSQVNLEELVAKFLESSNSIPAAAILGVNVQDKRNDDTAAEVSQNKKKSDAEAGEPESKVSEPSAEQKPSENIGGEAKEKKQKKRKDKADPSAANAASDEATETVKNNDKKLDVDGEAKEKKQKDKVDLSGVNAAIDEPTETVKSDDQKLDVDGETKEKQKKKKNKKDKGDASAANAASGETTETVNNDDKKVDGKKKKSKKQGKDDDVEARLEKAEMVILNKLESAEKVNGDGNESREEEPKSQNDGAVEKKKKKKKDKSVVETSEKTDAGSAAAEADGARGKSDAVETVKEDNEKKAKKKRKKSSPEENVQVEAEEAVGKDSVPKPDDANKSGMDVDENHHQGKPSNENGVAGKKRKLEEVEGSIAPVTPKEDSTANQSLSNGFAEDKTNEDSNIKPSKRQKKSSEPKSVTPFQRIKVDSVTFADDRLQDNSYWAKGGADIGYGAKAQEILGQVRGRGFRHEKTKKKRGTYRGGQIDLQTHSIKFENSDDE